MRMNSLFDFYQSLLTPKQRNYMALYYLDDYSLGEIAEEFQVSRQAVYDNIKRTEQMIEEYEAKLLLFERYNKRQELLEELTEVIKLEDANSNALTLIKSLEKLD
ncbi:putative DNA-binding protein [Alkalihalobacillus sp. R86527]|uniref:putative DNA-binding protein n=1 Tax=Alkalihalobacillus sp. R86527 TaxID=3093863 RepID=UPI003671396F